MKRQIRRRRAVSTEALESRQVLSAMTASVVGGVLTITGSADADLVMMGTAPPEPGRMVDYTRVQIRTSSGSTINGQREVVMTGVTVGINVNLYGGDDTVLIQKGANSIGAPIQQTLLPATNISTGMGNDSTIVDRADVRGLTWNGGGGNDRFISNGIYQSGQENKLGNVSLNGAAGNDSFSFIDTKLQTVALQGGLDADDFTFERTQAGATTIETHDGADTITFRSGWVSDALTMKMAGGDDRITFPATGFSAGNTWIDLGSGNDRVDSYIPTGTTPSETRFRGRLDMFGRDGNDVIAMGLTVADQLFADMGTGEDNLALYGVWAGATLNGGDGIDDVLRLRSWATPPRPVIRGFERIGY